MTEGYTYTVSFIWSSDRSGTTTGYANIRVFKDESMFIGETQTDFILGVQSLDDVKLLIETLAQGVVDQFLANANINDILALMELSKQPEQPSSEVEPVNFDPVLVALTNAKKDAQQNTEDVLLSLLELRNTVAEPAPISQPILDIQSGITNISSMQQLVKERLEGTMGIAAQLNTKLGAVQTAVTSTDAFDALQTKAEVTKTLIQNVKTNTENALAKTDEQSSLLLTALDDVMISQDSANTKLVQMDTKHDTLKERFDLLEESVADILLITDQIPTTLQSIEEVSTRVDQVTDKIDKTLASLQELLEQTRSEYTALLQTLTTQLAEQSDTLIVIEDHVKDRSVPVEGVMDAELTKK